MKTAKTLTLIATCAAIALTSLFGTSTAITGNYAPDQTPYVCVVVLFSDAARTNVLSYGSGVLISPTVVLTAGHCVAGGAAASVCFDQGPITYAVDENGKIQYNTDQPIYDGTPVAYTPYIASLLAGIKPSQALQTSDVGLISLDKPVQEVTTYPSLPAAGLADNLAVKTDLQVIGYGVQEQITPRGHGVNSWVGTISRNSATVQLLSNNFQGSSNYLKCTANAAQGKGGAAFGDSGGPVLYSNNGQNVVLAVNAYVNNGNCEGVTYHTRIDNPAVLNWINGYM
jgi:hypothetical protein